MAKYKLKKEARQFFDKKLHHEVEKMSFWEREFINKNLLDECPKVYVDLGKPLDEGSTSLHSWKNTDYERYGEFHFTVRVDEMNGNEYENVKIAEVMDEIQKVLNKFFS